MQTSKVTMFTSLGKNDSIKDLDIETLINYLGFDKKHFNVLYEQEIVTDSKLKSESHQAKSAEHRREVRTRLAELRGVDPSTISYPRSNDKLTEYEKEIKLLE